MPASCSRPLRLRVDAQAAGMKSPLAALIALALALLPGCMTPTQQAADATFLAGQAFATAELAKNPAALKGLQDFAAALPSIPLGKVSAFQMGVLNAELSPLTAASAANPTYSQAYSQVGAAISGLSQIAGGNGGNPTAEVGVLIAWFTDFANGVNQGIQFWQGQQSVAAPAPAAPPAAQALPTH